MTGLFSFQFKELPKNSPSKARGSTRRGGSVSLSQSSSLQSPSYNVDSIIFVWQLIFSNHSLYYKNAE